MNKDSLIGRKVRIRNLYLFSEQERGEDPGITSDMLQYSNSIVTITSVSDYSGYFKIREDEGDFHWDLWMFYYVIDLEEESIYE